MLLAVGSEDLRTHQFACCRWCQPVTSLDGYPQRSPSDLEYIQPDGGGRCSPRVAGIHHCSMARVYSEQSHARRRTWGTCLLGGELTRGDRIDDLARLESRGRAEPGPRTRWRRQRARTGARARTCRSSPRSPRAALVALIAALVALVLLVALGPLASVHGRCAGAPVLHERARRSAPQPGLARGAQYLPRARRSPATPSRWVAVALDGVPRSSHDRMEKTHGGRTTAQHPVGRPDAGLVAAVRA